MRSLGLLVGVLLVSSSLAFDLKSPQNLYVLTQYCTGSTVVSFSTSSYFSTTWKTGNGVDTMTFVPHNWGSTATQTCQTISVTDWYVAIGKTGVAFNQHILPFLSDPTNDMIAMKCTASSGTAIFQNLLIINGKVGITIYGFHPNSSNYCLLNVNPSKTVAASALEISGSLGHATSSGCDSKYQLGGTITLNKITNLQRQAKTYTAKAILTIGSVTLNNVKYSNANMVCKFAWIGGRTFLKDCVCQNCSFQGKFFTFFFFTFADGTVVLKNGYANPKTKVFCTYVFNNLKGELEESGDLALGNDEMAEEISELSFFNESPFEGLDQMFLEEMGEGFPEEENKESSSDELDESFFENLKMSLEIGGFLQ